ncbi:hypothetical protein [Capnocytophaga sputigena]|uniref:hypothetical protein n=1 Tax=Capnocytophaga sputigena TaxID=1019 RepID=UPI00288C1322|nr:hypothetical protein [Capnocytophaga sputigena]
MKCIENIKDIALDCQYRPIKGLKHRVLVIPYKDIDRRYTAMSEDKSVITHFQLYPTKRGYLFELSNAFKVNGSQKFSGGFTHELSIKIDKADSGNIATMNALTKGTYVLIVETMSNMFEVLGYEAGVVVSSIQRDYAGNVIGLTFSTPIDVKELRMVALWGEGDYLAMSKKLERKAFVGENLLRNSGQKITNNNYNIATYYLTEELKIGDLLTITIKGQLGNGKIAFALYDQLGNVEQCILYDRGKGIYQNAFNYKGYRNGDKMILSIWTYDGSVSAESTIEWIKLEKGNTPTEWCPADED